MTLNIKIIVKSRETPDLSVRELKPSTKLVSNGQKKQFEWVILDWDLKLEFEH